jgi:hypothetical protein
MGPDNIFFHIFIHIFLSDMEQSEYYTDVVTDEDLFLYVGNGVESGWC